MKNNVNPNAPFAQARAGDYVYCYLNGWGTIVEIDKNITEDEFPISVMFPDRVDHYDYQGRIKKECSPVLFWDEVNIKAPDRPHEEVYLKSLKEILGTNINVIVQGEIGVGNITIPAEIVSHLGDRVSMRKKNDEDYPYSLGTCDIHKSLVIWEKTEKPSLIKKPKKNGGKRQYGVREIEEIRISFAVKSLNIQELANKHKCSRGMIRSILTGEKYAEVLHYDKKYLPKEKPEGVTQQEIDTERQKIIYRDGHR